MIKIITICTLLFTTFLNADTLDAKQLFNKKIVKVKKENLSVNKSFYGITKIDESSLVDIVSRFDGYITKLYANKSYMSIKKNEPLYSIYSEDIMSIQNELQVAKDFNKNIYNSTLLRLGNLDISKQNQQKIKEGKLDSKGLVVTSNVDGILVAKNINNKSFVQKGANLLQLADLQTIWFVASIYQDDLAFVKNNSNANITIDGIDKEIKTKVDFIYPIFDENSKTVDVRFILDNKELNLLPSMFGKVDIEVNKSSKLTLPKTAVLKKASDYFVFKQINAQEFEPIKIKANRISSNKYEILEGLQENDEVINNALFLLDSDAVTNALYETDNEDW
ncbi:efflux RND transporter periplasmic adaptor subunit [Arcobacter aquimarinus]|uniref:Copper/silver efflux system, membrane fusion protein CusB n=1 Tax=Arcobacter aquimarinus TaxID=1315211 RepID=A0AAE7E0H4_9BACT|nr:efflux RND transporter periplasmic adaptor subunit [Arcobacter aquimarinus]QKE24847.1 putative copper/silver efflux system, membrane fusion protein CusB [Arcobacter aquimarinus]RXI35421.1 cation transporter [Arcobacter aquimarinus]